jgi:hypothetical protein
VSFNSVRYSNLSQDSSVGIMTNWTARVPFLAVQDFSLLHIVKNHSGAHPTSYLVFTRALSLGEGVKWQGREADHLPPSSAEVKKGGAIPPLLHMFHGILLNKLITGTSLPFLQYSNCRLLDSLKINFCLQ